MSIRSRSGSFRSEDIVQCVQDLLEEKKYPLECSHAQSFSSPTIGVTPYSQKLKDLIINSVSMETTGDIVISSLTGQQPLAVDYVIGYKSLIHFLEHETTPLKLEIKQSIAYPLFIYCYLVLVAMDESDKAQSLYTNLSNLLSRLSTSSHDIKELNLLTDKDSLLTSAMAEKFRKNKYICRISDPSFKLLTNFLQTHPVPCLMNLIEKNFSIEVFGSSPPVTDQKHETKKALSFVKPQVNPVSEIDICLPYARPRPHPLPPPPPIDTEAAAIKGEYQQRLVLAAQQLDPSPPSLLLCSVATPTSCRLHAASICESRKKFCYSLHDCSLRVNSWLPTTTSGHVTPSTESCDILRGHRGPVYGMSFNRNGEFLLSSSEDTTVRLWDMETKTCKVVYTGHQYPVWGVAFSPVDGFFTSCGYDCTTRLWNTEYVYPLRVFVGHEKSVEVARWHPNGNYVATGSLDHTLRLWDINSGNSVRLFVGSKHPIVSLAFSPFGKKLASGAADGTITLWDISSGRSIMEYKGHASKITSLSFSSDGTILASSGFDHFVKLWNIKASLGPSYQNNISSYATSPVLPLSTSFIQRNCLVAVGVKPNNDKSTHTSSHHYYN